MALAIDPTHLGGQPDHIEQLFARIEADGGRLPGSGRGEKRRRMRGDGGDDDDGGGGDGGGDGDDGGGDSDDRGGGGDDRGGDSGDRGGGGDGDPEIEIDDTLFEEIIHITNGGDNWTQGYKRAS